MSLAIYRGGSFAGWIVPVEGDSMPSQRSSPENGQKLVPISMHLLGLQPRGDVIRCGETVHPK